MSETRMQIARLLQEGVPKAEIARRLDIAITTVSYHAEVLARPPAAPAVPAAVPAARRQVRTRERVAGLLADGLNRAEIARRLNVSKATVSYHARRLGAPVDERGARRYDWAAVQAYYDQGHSVDACARAFGFSRQTWHAAKKRGDIRTRPHAMPVEELLQGRRNRSHVKLRLLGAGLLEPRCSRCGIDEWQGAPISLCLHHINGSSRDNRLENLTLLCPNCHAQTDNFAGRNRRAA